jgi:glycosyltransferase involved in cell wall biosynthesis
VTVPRASLTAAPCAPPSATTEPETSVVIACYNSARFIRETIDSILANAETYPSLEVVAVDDASTDETLSVLRAYGERVRVLAKSRNEGPCRARNDGIRLARGRFVALCDHDDLWAPDKLAFQMPLFADPAIGLVCSRSSSFDERRVVRSLDANHRLPDDGNAFADLLISNFITCSSAVVRRAAIDSAGAFDENIFPAEDIDLWLRIARTWKVGRVEKIVTHHRISATQYSHDKYRMKTARMPVIAKHARLLERPADRARVMANAWFVFGTDHWYARETKAARQKFLAALRHRPLTPKYWLWLMLTGVPQGLRERISTLRRSLPKR